MVAHLLSGHHVNAYLHNAKCSFVCGLAHGLGKPILMLADISYASPIDYQLLLKPYHSAKQCEKLVEQWLTETYDVIAPQLQRVAEQRAAKESVSQLRNLFVGQEIAENEADDIDAYFVSTAAYQEVLTGQQTLFVGRKGTGKTANLYRAVAQLRGDVRNFVCVIKPIGYEIDGLVRMLKQAIPTSERGYLVESLWKYLIYTELANSVAEAIGRKDEWAKTDQERELVAFVETHEDIVSPAFSVRLEAAVAQLCGVERETGAENQRSKVSEILHGTMIKQLRQLLGSVLERYERVAVLIDNLDKAWPSRGEVDNLVALLFGLIGVAGRIVEEFHSSSYWKRKVRLTVAVFLRSDIFARVQESAREKDKLSCSYISWNDPQLLLRVIEERFSYRFDRLTPDEIWNEFFAPSVDGLPVKDFLIENTLPRPRDLIYLVKAAISNAANRGHAYVETGDLIDARNAYSQYVLDAIVAEDDPTLGKLEAVLYEFAGSAAELTRSQVEAQIGAAGVTGDDVSRYVDLLCDLNFLGIGANGKAFRFTQTERERKVQQVISRKLAEHGGASQETYRVNPAFYPVLQIG